MCHAYKVTKHCIKTWKPSKKRTDMSMKKNMMEETATKKFTNNLFLPPPHLTRGQKQIHYKQEADKATGFTDYCANCNCIYDFYPKRREVIND